MLDTRTWSLSQVGSRVVEGRSSDSQIVVCLGMFAVLGSVCEPGSPRDQQSTVAPQSDIGLKSVVEDLNI